jgi:hypothetical protein
LALAVLAKIASSNGSAFSLGAKMDDLAAESALPFEGRYRRSCSAMRSRAEELHRRLSKWFITGKNTALHVVVGTHS